MAELRRITPVLFLNIGDGYARYGDGSGVAPKSLAGIPERMMLEMIDSQGWILRNRIIWVKANPKPESVRDRFHTAYEHLFFFVGEPDYFFDPSPILQDYQLGTIKRIERALRNGAAPHTPKLDPSGLAEDPHQILMNMARRWSEGKMRGRIPTDVWKIHTSQFRGDHRATFPEQLAEWPILTCSKPDDLIFDPFSGSGTVGLVAKRLGRNFLGCDLNEKYAVAANARIMGTEK